MSARRNLGPHAFSPLAEPCSLDHHVVGRPLAAAGIPGRQQTAIEELDHARGMVALAGRPAKIAVRAKNSGSPLALEARHARTSARHVNGADHNLGFIWAGSPGFRNGAIVIRTRATEFTGRSVLWQAASRNAGAR